MGLMELLTGMTKWIRPLKSMTSDDNQVGLVALGNPDPLLIPGALSVEDS